MATEETVAHISKSLGEVEETPLTQISEVVRVLGEEGALALLKETLDIEKKGGMLLADGTRRRSPGGVYFQLARKKLPADEKKQIFREKKLPASDAPPPSSPVAPDASKFPRRRVVEVIPARAAPARPKPGAFVPPELPSALTRARIRQQVSLAVAPLPLEEQYHLLLDLVADIHDRVTGAGGAGPSAAEAAPPRATRSRAPRQK
ncbi:MAG TPA: phosphorylated adapter RNA export RNA-binding domain-containing protein [Polyangiaceae bacterium]|nr:phosphorylated adapter RNA export RNA-binding domain-containing protein [Polyangiaceae bacterium]